MIETDRLCQTGAAFSYPMGCKQKGQKARSLASTENDPPGWGKSRQGQEAGLLSIKENIG